METLETMSRERELPVERWYGIYPALVTDLEDPLDLGRVRVHLPWSEDQGGAGPGAKTSTCVLWARLVVPAAGSSSGVWVRPEVGDEVLIGFEAGDPTRPYVLGSMWNGQDLPPTDVDHSNDNRSKFVVARGGARIAVTESISNTRIDLTTDEGANVRLEGGVVKIEDHFGNQVVLSSSGVEITATTKVSVNASTVDITASSVEVSAPMSRFRGVVKCDTMIADSVVASKYTPGAGNIW